MALPVSTLWNLNMSFGRKLGILAIFFLAWVTIAFDILRLAKSETHSGTLLETLYTSLQVEVAVIISALPSYRVLGRSRGKNSDQQTYEQRGTVSNETSNGTTMLHPLRHKSRLSEDIDGKSCSRGSTVADSSSLPGVSNHSMEVEQSV